jgi:hypothetical protein
LTRESTDLYNESVVARDAAAAMLNTAINAGNVARANTNPQIRAANLAIAQQAFAAYTGFRQIANQKIVASAQKRVENAPYIVKINDFLKDK